MVVDNVLKKESGYSKNESNLALNSPFLTSLVLRAYVFNGALPT